MRFRQHIPNFVDGVDPDTIEFGGLEELLADERISRWRQDGYIGHGPFHRFSLATDHDETLLMAEYDEGRHWWVVGYIDDATGLDLPQWTPNREGRA